MAETIPLKDKFDIQASSPIPEYDSPTAKAFSCTAREDEYDGLMALLCDPRVPLVWIRLNPCAASRASV